MDDDVAYLLVELMTSNSAKNTQNLLYTKIRPIIRSTTSR